MQPQASVSTIADHYQQAFKDALLNLVRMRTASEEMAMSRDDAALLAVLRNLDAARDSYRQRRQVATAACPSESVRESMELMYLTAGEVATIQTLMNWRAVESDRLAEVGAGILKRVAATT